MIFLISIPWTQVIYGFLSFSVVAVAVYIFFVTSRSRFASPSSIENEEQDENPSGTEIKSEERS